LIFLLDTRLLSAVRRAPSTITSWAADSCRSTSWRRGWRPGSPSGRRAPV